MSLTRHRKTIVRPEPGPIPGFLQKGVHPVLQRVYANRGVTSARELERGLDRLLPVTLLDGATEAATLLEGVIRRAGRILVIGDFDADGATSTALAVRALRAMGAAEVDYLVPNRFRYGYGLTPGIVAEARERSPDLLLTVDNGISSIEGVAAARAAGMAVLITDHHLPGPALPDADVIVDPCLQQNGFPSDALAGVGVIFYVMAALRGRLRGRGWFERQGLREPNLARLLDLVALGTVADVVPLDHNNRVLVYQGLRRIRHGHCCTGISALVQTSGRSRQRLTAADLGFAVAPRLNAAGRLDDMSIGVECLVTDDPARAEELAAQLDSLNRERRGIEQAMQQQALDDLERLLPDGELPWGVCLLRDEWHQGVIGLVAGRVRERLHRPVIAFAPGENPGEIKGSARSIPGLHIRDTLDAVAVACPGLLDRFGGHAMAAGMTLRRADFDAFRAAFDAQVRQRLAPEALQERVCSDGPLAPDQLSMQLAAVLRDSGPWGQGFPEPLFDGRFRVMALRVLNDRHLKMVLEPEQGGALLDAIAFNQVAHRPEGERPLIHIAYRLDLNEYRGARSLQLVVVHLEPVS